MTGAVSTDVRTFYNCREAIEDTNASGVTLQRYVFGPGVDEPVMMYTGPGVRFFLTDPQGSVVGLPNAAGVLQASYRYPAFGVPDLFASPPGGGGNRLRYTGQRLDAEIGLYDYRARAYSPTLGRFLQTDPIGYADGLNLYAYVGNDPVNFVDPRGLAAEAVMDGGRQTFDMIGNDIDRLQRGFSRDPLGTIDSVLGSFPQTRAGKSMVGGLEALGLFAATTRGVSKATPGVARSVVPQPLLGKNPTVAKNRVNTDVRPYDDRQTAKSIFRNQTKGQKIQQFEERGKIRRRADSGIQIRMNPDGTTRIDLPGRGVKDLETIHFNR